MKICVIGTGYVGLVVGTCFAESGIDVTGVDQDEGKIRLLKSGGIPIYEPGLSDVLARNVERGRLHFTTDLAAAVKASEIVFITVGTPSREGGQVDLKSVLAVAKQVAQTMDNRKLVVIKSTVPCGTGDAVEKVMRENTRQPFDVAVNPEFLKEGVAMEDFMKPNRVVIGLEREELKPIFQRLYEPFLRTGKPLFFMNRASAEMTKYAANGLLALKISFMNEIANLCDAFGADVDLVRKGLGSDERIGPSFLFPGVGYGGSCFPKDVDALVHTAREAKLGIKTLEASAEVNRRQQHVLADKIKAYFKNDLKGRKIAVWGLSFKPRTDDMREAPAVAIIADLLAAGAVVAAFDPVAHENAAKTFKEKNLQVDLAASNYAAAQGAHALALVTEWNEFRRPDFMKLKETMAHAAIFDGRNIFDPQEVKELGFHYQGIGRR